MQALEKDPDNEKDADAPDAHPLDQHIGNKLRQRRLMLGMTQDKIGNVLGLTFQQVQKYERGQNRISASRLFEVARLLQVPLAYFFENVPPMTPAMPGMAEQGQDTIEDAEALPPAIPQEYNSRETADLLRAYYRVEDQKKRRRVVDLLRAMNDED